MNQYQTPEVVIVGHQGQILKPEIYKIGENNYGKKEKQLGEIKKQKIGNKIVKEQEQIKQDQEEQQGENLQKNQNPNAPDIENGLQNEVPANISNAQCQILISEQIWPWISIFYDLILFYFTVKICYGQYIAYQNRNNIYEDINGEFKKKESNAIDLNDCFKFSEGTITVKDFKENRVTLWLIIWSINTVLGMLISLLQFIYFITELLSNYQLAENLQKFVSSFQNSFWLDTQENKLKYIFVNYMFSLSCMVYEFYMPLIAYNAIIFSFQDCVKLETNFNYDIFWTQFSFYIILGSTIYSVIQSYVYFHYEIQKQGKLKNKFLCFEWVVFFGPLIFLLVVSIQLMNMINIYYEVRQKMKITTEKLNIALKVLLIGVGIFILVVLFYGIIVSFETYFSIGENVQLAVLFFFSIVQNLFDLFFYMIEQTMIVEEIQQQQSQQANDKHNDSNLVLKTDNK